VVKIAGVYLAAVLYAVVRYAVFMPQNYEHLPVNVGNKGVSMAAALCFATAFWRQWQHTRGAAGGTDPAAWFRAGVFGAVCHVPLSLSILRPG
jgi:hypothetical protein